MKIEFLEIAQAELDHAYEWYEAQQKNLGIQFLDEFDASVRRIVAFPEACVLIGEDVRRCLIKRFPYGILYALDADKVIVSQWRICIENLIIG